MLKSRTLCFTIFPHLKLPNVFSRSINCIWCLIFLFGLSCNTNSNQGASSKNAESILFTTDIAEDATLAVLARIMSADKSPISEIKFESGTYHFHPEKGKEFFVFISNHNDEVIRTAFPLYNFKGLTIDGQGATFIFHRRMIPFLIDHCKNRLAPAFRVTHTYGFDAQNVIVQHAGGMGLIAENSADLTLDNFKVTPSNGRMVSTTADATHFVGCCEYDRGIIRFETDNDNKNIAFKNIEIVGNKINHFDNLFLEIANTDGLVFKGNTITYSGTFPKLFPKNPAIRVKSSTNVVFENNTYKGDAEVILETVALKEKAKFN